MKGRCVLLFLLVGGISGFCQDENVIQQFLQKGHYLDAFQYALQRDTYYTNISLMLFASKIVLKWGLSTNGEHFILSNSDGETRSYYFPVTLVLGPFTNFFSTNETLWELLVRYYDRGLTENWFLTREESASALLGVMERYVSVTKKADPILLASQVPALLILGQTNGAWQMASNLFRLYPRESRVVYVYADLLRVMGNRKDALKIIQQTYPYVKNTTEEALLTFLSGRLYLEEGNVREALFVLERSLLLSTNREVLFLLLEGYRRVNDWLRFTDRAMLALSLNPENREVLSSIGRFFILSRQREWCEFFFEKALVSYGEQPFRRGVIYFYWGEVYRNLSLPQRALWAYERAKEAFLLVEPVPMENVVLIDMMIYRVKTP